VTTKKRSRQKPWARRTPLPARELALQILVATESRSAYSDRLLETRLREADLRPEDAHLVTALVQGALRHRGTLDHHLAYFARENWNGLPAWMRGVLRIGALQILFMDRIPARAAVDESVKLAKKYGHPGTAGLVNALLRKLARGERAPYPDPKNEKLVAVDLKAHRRLPQAVTLAQIKADRTFADLPIVRQGRLSVSPVTAPQWKKILQLSGADD